MAKSPLRQDQAINAKGYSRQLSPFAANEERHSIRDGAGYSDSPVALSVQEILDYSVCHVQLLLTPQIIAFLNKCARCL
jgi:hypothetical protein